MMRHFIGKIGLAATVLVLAAGCATTGSEQMQTTVYDTHRRIVKLDKELDSSVTRLNETTATLLARVDESDQQTRTLRGMLEENQVKLDALAQELNNMKTTLYRHWNLSTSGPVMPPSPNVSTGAVTIEGAPGTLAPPPMPTPPPLSAPPQNELLDSAPVPTDNLSTQAPAPPVAAPAIAEEMTEAAPPPMPAAAAPADAAGDPRVLYQQAQRSYANDDFPGALSQFDAYLAQYMNVDPSLSANAQFWKAKCLLNLERYPESIQSFETLRSAFPTSTKVPFAMHNQAVAHSRLGQGPQAERLMEAVIDQFPISPAADQARADLKKLRGE